MVYSHNMNRSYTIDIINVKRNKRMVKSASTDGANTLDEVKQCMQTIYQENPSYWPYGIDVDYHDSVYAIRDKMTNKVAGWVGWQETWDEGDKVGCYSIGILPEFRGKGFAKEAVAKIILEKSANVDIVRAYIMPDNLPSHKLAESLNVEVKHEF